MIGWLLTLWQVSASEPANIRDRKGHSGNEVVWFHHNVVSGRPRGRLAGRRPVCRHANNSVFVRRSVRMPCDITATRDPSAK